jgi:hypothetical protein
MMLLSVMLFSSACAKDTNITKVFQAARKLHLQFNDGNFHDIYAEADPKFRESISEDAFIAKLDKLRQTHGRIQQSSLMGFEASTWWQRHFPNLKPVRFVGFYNHCEQDGFQEFMDWDVRGGEPKLLRYENDIESMNSNRRS